MTTDLVAFLEARLDEEAVVARAATFRHGHWMTGWGPEADPTELYEITQADIDAADHCDGSHAASSPNPCEFNIVAQPGPTLEAVPAMLNVFAHIARHDPARVLADVAAKRAIIGHCAGTIAAAGDPPGIDPDDVPAIVHVLRLLTQPFADHPDFDPSWSPKT